MSDRRRDDEAAAGRTIPQIATATRDELPYERPGIIWEEAYPTTCFGISCAKQPGNPPCNVGPISS